MLANETLFFVSNKGTAVALNAKTGKRRWRRGIGTLSAASPAWDDGRLFAVTLDGRITCLRADNGRVIWKKDIPSRTESSPLVRNGRVYFGSEDGTVYALNAKNGHTIWTYGASGAVKAALAYFDHKLYFGAYGGTRVRDPRERRPGSLDQRDFGALAGAERQLLLDARRGVRPCLHGEHGWSRVFVHGKQR